MKNEIILFEEENIKLEVSVKDNTVWLNRQQIAELFDRDIKTVSKHINNSLSEELENESVVAKFATTAKDGKTYKVEYYNLEMINSVGFRVKSKRGIMFRKWANKILNDYQINGYVVNEKRLKYLEKTLKIIDIATRIDESLRSNDANEILNVIGSYTKALNLLDDYDHKRIKKIGKVKSNNKITYDECIGIINKLKFYEKSQLFALEKDNGLKSIVDSIYQTFNGNDVYMTIEEKPSFHRHLHKKVI